MRIEKWMKKKQAYLLRKKLDKLKLCEVTSSKWFIAGGACTSVFTLNPINDLDIFFNVNDEEEFDEVFGYLVYHFQKNFGVSIEDAFETDAALSYNIDGNRVQLIKKFRGTPEEIISNFDYSVVQCAFLPHIEEFVMSSNFLYDNASRTLRYNTDIEGVSYPIASLMRAEKYIKRGYKFTGVEALKLGLTINNLKINTYKDLKEQIEGIDTYYFKGLTDKLLNEGEKSYDLNEFMEMAEKILSELWGEEE